MLAERYGADNGRIARIILLSTTLAFVTFTTLAWSFGAGRVNALLDRQRIDVDRPAHQALERAALRVQLRQPGGEKTLQAARDADSISICMRSTLATRATGGGTGG